MFLSGPGDASDQGIAVIYQEPTLFPDLSVAENVFIGRQPLRSGRRIDARAMDREVEEIFNRLGVSLDPDRIARGLSIAEQQLVEIAKALTPQGARADHGRADRRALAGRGQAPVPVVETLRADGAAVVFISHRLEEVFAICQRVTVLRDGKLVLSKPLEGLTPDDLVRAMVGRDVQRGSHVAHTPGDVVLDVAHLTREGVFVDISFQVHAGEVVALAGLVGSGRIEVARADLRHRPLRRRLGDAQGPWAAPRLPHRRDGRRHRLRPGGPPPAGPRDGDVDGAQHRAGLDGPARRLGLIFKNTERGFSADWAQRLQVKYGRISDPVSLLSGGNQQKVVLAKWLAREPSLLIVDEPTRGIDIGTKAEVHRLLAALATDGVAVLVISSELPEVLTLADRVLVMREGRLAASLARADASEESIVAAGTGQSSRPHPPSTDVGVPA